MKKELILTVGLPHSGKSTWALEKTTCPIVNPDSIRLALHGQAFNPATERMVWTVAHYMAESLLLAGHGVVIIDATNVTEKRRAEWKNLVIGNEKVETTLKIFPTPPAECIARAKKAGRDDLVPVISRMMDAWDLEVPEQWCTPEREGGMCMGPFRCLHSPLKEK